MGGRVPAWVGSSVGEWRPNPGLGGVEDLDGARDADRPEAQSCPPPAPVVEDGQDSGRDGDHRPAAGAWCHRPHGTRWRPGAGGSRPCGRPATPSRRGTARRAARRSPSRAPPSIRRWFPPAPLRVGPPWTTLGSPRRDRWPPSSRVLIVGRDLPSRPSARLRGSVVDPPPRRPPDERRPPSSRRRRHRARARGGGPRPQSVVFAARRVPTFWRSGAKRARATCGRRWGAPRSRPAVLRSTRPTVGKTRWAEPSGRRSGSPRSRPAVCARPGPPAGLSRLAKPSRRRPRSPRSRPGRCSRSTPIPRSPSARRGRMARAVTATMRPSAPTTRPMMPMV